MCSRHVQEIACVEIASGENMRTAARADSVGPRRREM
jgi:hypothetical protein